MIQSSLLLFEKKGFHGVTVNEIVRKAKASKGGFYHHFTSKEELLYVIHDTFISYVLEKAAYANNSYTSPTDKLKAIIKDFVKVFDIYKPHISVFYQESIYLKPEYEHLIKQKRDQFKQLILQTIAEGQANGEFRKDLPAEITGMAILGMVNWTYKWYQPKGKNTIDEISDIFIELILQAILPNEATSFKSYNGTIRNHMDVWK
ncbi:TetR/AcrR family transcriptional regulator [Virgibacillus pantothenticus]|uniref:TetR family transcriptional regulator n=1 Tax=Virgibacillus pantothenticus TaxID=1473 RepID=A0A0L0QNT0_VIRPA|nr:MULTISPECIES: TetR/AcrR family transcriptional regulator [Virgibacillus]API94038.1 TetR family transcriptional regulator [Virgibacillus sp. 6R]KNE20290.1 TetR family transcriptional regulator [Virgibacillus pantothenticus]MBS7429408.1 TetR family transcriptional regulator [Virgibacillus sp. 19R1-5]MBU8568075.1 TetR/AcrR family transcriptional regulator [Virgibacillus pantothenticus]MBU8602021.1 TetR/AcrR family transcriptional regulator [Virgibacillus pantothenticus]